jgi:hypothetical protein
VFVTDLLVKLYDLPGPADVGPAREAGEGTRPPARGILVRRALAPELRATERWVAAEFGEGWASEVAVAFSRQPVSCFIAVKERQIVGFSCYDATARGFFGPAGVLEAERGGGVGKALLLACLHDMRQLGYGYAIIGGVGPVGFYQRTVGATVIEGSDPGIYPRLVRFP